MANIESISNFLQEELKNKGRKSVGAVEAATWLDSVGLISDSSNKPGQPLRILLRKGLIVGQRQDPNKRWFIDAVTVDDDDNAIEKKSITQSSIKYVRQKADVIGQMRRNINRILNRIANINTDEYRSYGERVRAFRQQASGDDSRIADFMRAFGETRNKVEYQGYTLDEEEWQYLAYVYRQIEEWACGHMYTAKSELEEVDF